MPYKHAGEVGDVWKHLPLCEILKAEQPVKYHETNSAYSGYTISANAKTEYGVFRVLGSNDDAFLNSEYRKLLKMNGIDNLRYTGSPGLALEILSDRAQYFFHDLERKALDDVEAYALRKGLQKQIRTFCGDSIGTFLAKEYLVGESDFAFLDPYCPFDQNESGFNFFDVFAKAMNAKSKTLLWYGYESLDGQQQILQRLKALASEHKVEIWSFDAWLEIMSDHGCEINPGVPGCGLACAHLSDESIGALKRYLKFMKNNYANATYCGNKAALLVETNQFI